MFSDPPNAPTSHDAAMLSTLSGLLIRQISRLEAALDAAQDPAVQAVVIYAQASREEALERIQGELRQLGNLPEPTLQDAFNEGGIWEIDDEADEGAMQEVAHGEAELRTEFRKGVKDQMLTPHMRRFLYHLLEGVTPLVGPYGRMH